MTVATGSPPLLFMHGAFTGAWCWEEHMAPWFRERGHVVVAIDLPGRRGGDDYRRLQDFTLADYVDAVAAAVRSMPLPPVIVGHSMGGLLAMRAALGETVAGLVLMSSVPPTGLSPAALEMAMNDPQVFQQVTRILDAGDGQGDPEVLRRALFSDAIDPDLAGTYLARCQNESQLAVMAMHGPQLFNPLAYWGLPMLILGGEGDRLIGPAHVYWMAALLGRPADIIPGIGHAMMLEPAWRDAAERIDGWLAENFAHRGARAHG